MKLKGYFLVSKGIAWTIPGREVRRMYREKAYKPPAGWRFRRNIDFMRRDKAGFYVLKGDTTHAKQEAKRTRETAAQPDMFLHPVPEALCNR